MENKSEKDLREEMEKSVSWLFGGNYTSEIVEDMKTIIRAFNNLAYLERDNVKDILDWLYKSNEILEDVDSWLEETYEKACQ